MVQGATNLKTSDSGRLEANVLVAHSAIYAGRIRHRRFAPTQNTFDYRLFMLYLDLDEIEHVFSPFLLWSCNRPNINCFQRRDYHGSAEKPLKKAILDTVESKTGCRPDGPVRLLTHVRTLGYVFNPVSFYYCFDQAGALQAIAAEITNTPWLERYTYVLPVDQSDQRGVYRFAFDKDFHVSPFMPMEQRYHWAFNVPSENLMIHMVNTASHTNADQSSEVNSIDECDLDEPKVFDATLRLKREPITRRTLMRVMTQYPAMASQIVMRIYWQALKLKIKKTPFYPHPSTL